MAVSAERIVKRAIRPRSIHNPAFDVAGMSMRMALRAYFSTYDSLAPHSASFIRSAVARRSNHMHRIEYFEAATQTILCLHHAVELTMKHILRRVDPLLAVKIPDRASSLLKIARGQRIASAELERWNTVEFYAALQRLRDLRKVKKLKSTAGSSVVDNWATLEALNALRNGLIHRGSKLLSYQALDELMVRHLLPIVRHLVAAPDCPELGGSLHRPTASGIDPLAQLVDHGRRKRLDYGTIAFFKAVGRAAYDNPLVQGRYAQLINSRTAKVALREANSEWHQVAEIRDCPVCGL